MTPDELASALDDLAATGVLTGWSVEEERTRYTMLRRYTLEMPDGARQMDGPAASMFVAGSRAAATH